MPKESIGRFVQIGKDVSPSDPVCRGLENFSLTKVRSGCPIQIALFERALMKLITTFFIAGVLAVASFAVSRWVFLDRPMNGGGDTHRSCGMTPNTWKQQFPRQWHGPRVRLPSATRSSATGACLRQMQILLHLKVINKFRLLFNILLSDSPCNDHIQ